MNVICKISYIYNFTASEEAWGKEIMRHYLISEKCRYSLPESHNICRFKLSSIDILFEFVSGSGSYCSDRGAEGEER